MIVAMDVAGIGPVRMAGLPVKLSETPGRLDRPPPYLGEHTASVLARLGYGADEVRRLAASGAVGLHTARAADTAAD